MTTTPVHAPGAPAPGPRGRAQEDELVRAHLPLVGRLVHGLLGRLPSHVSRDDLTSAGMAALAQAARAYDPGRGVPFGPFATTRVRGALLDELRGHDWASRSVRAAARRREAATESLTADLGRTPTQQEVADRMGVSVARLDAVDDDLHRAVVLSLHGFGDDTDVDALVTSSAPGPEQTLLAREEVGYLRDAVDALPDRLRTVVVRSYLEERPMAEIAAQLGVSESRVSQMRAEALTLLRDGMNSQLDPERLDRRDGCVGRRRAAYYATLAARSTFRDRLAPVGAATTRAAGE